MPDHATYIRGAAAATALGGTVRENCDALIEGRTAFSEPAHFDAKGRKLGVDHELDGGSGSRAFRLLAKLRDVLDFAIPSGTRLFVATTVGAIDLLERGGETDTAQEFLKQAERVFGLPGGVLVSAACASGQTAVALAMRQIEHGDICHALVVGGDVASEFVTEGFAALGAFSKSVCRPYDAARDGLTLGEAAGALLLSGEPGGAGRISGAAENGDAAHITSPDLTGAMLAEACRAALGGETPAGVVGHGTGTIYNDQAEIAALGTLFPDAPPPLFSLKGNIGHTLGATGVLQIALGLELARRGVMPPQANLRTPMPGANVAAHPRKLSGSKLLSLNVGFGGLNSAAVLEAL
jgi:3-oxoacyl-(acyl-carrier-protein) synthase